MCHIFQADLYCDSCAEAIIAQGWTVDTGDSDDHPYPAAPDESDSPTHCASGCECLEPIDLTLYGLRADAALIGAESRLIGADLTYGLTDHGQDYLAELLAEPNPTAYQAALHTYWRESFNVSENDPEYDEFNGAV